MYNLIVLGCGRSGTSMVAGTLAGAGYWTDNQVWEADAYNPKGYFEAFEVHRINDQLLTPVIKSPLERLAADHPALKAIPDSQSWLGLMPLEAALTLDQALLPQMRYYLAKQPYCLKDVRFSYTLDVWRPYLQNTKFVCVFRHPSATIRSLVHYASNRPYLKPLNLDAAYAQALWVCMYSHILQKHANLGDWFFIHYDQLFDEAVLERLEMFAQANVDRTFPESALRKPPEQAECKGEVAPIYAELCKRAGFTPG